MMLSHHTPADAKYAELLDIAETLTSIYQSLIFSSAEINCSSFDLFRNCSLLIHWLLLIKLCRWLTHSLRFCSRYYLPTGFCASPSWFLTSFLASGFFASLSRHPLSQVHQRPLFHLQRPDLGLHCPCTSCILNYRCNPFSSERFSFLNHSFLELSSFLIYLIKLISWNCYSVTWNTVAVVSCIFLFRTHQSTKHLDKIFWRSCTGKYLLTG